MKLSEKAIATLEFLKDNVSREDLIVQDIAEATGFTPAQINGTVTALAKKGLVVRTPGEIELEDKTHKAVKFVTLTEEGKALDLDNLPEDEDKAKAE